MVAEFVSDIKLRLQFAPRESTNPQLGTLECHCCQKCGKRQLKSKIWRKVEIVLESVVGTAHVSNSFVSLYSYGTLYLAPATLPQFLWFLTHGLFQWMSVPVHGRWHCFLQLTEIIIRPEYPREHTNNKLDCCQKWGKRQLSSKIWRKVKIALESVVGAGLVSEKKNWNSVGWNQRDMRPNTACQSVYSRSLSTSLSNQRPRFVHENSDECVKAIGTCPRGHRPLQNVLG